MANENTTDRIDELLAVQVRDLYAQLRAALARAEAAEAKLRRVIDLGHNDECLFCGFKDRVAALAEPERQQPEVET